MLIHFNKLIHSLTVVNECVFCVQMSMFDYVLGAYWHVFNTITIQVQIFTQFPHIRIFIFEYFYKYKWH